MSVPQRKKVGYACAYTPLPLIHAAGFAPYRVLPMTDCGEQSGGLLHDNLCPHVKRIVDRAMAGDLPDLAGMVLINSCDSMRRLADAWAEVRPDDWIALVDLPVTCEESSVSFFAGELQALWRLLLQWAEKEVNPLSIHQSMVAYNQLAEKFLQARRMQAEGRLTGGAVWLQGMVNLASVSSIDRSLKALDAGLVETGQTPEGVPVFLFGNLLPDPDMVALFESCGARILADDMCTGERMFVPWELKGEGDIFDQLSRGLLNKNPCARTFDPERPLGIAEDILERSRQVNARGVIGHTMKFCDPYLDRLPAIRKVLKDAGMPFLWLEGDCSLRSLGQHRTRIEAFVEMLG